MKKLNVIKVGGQIVEEPASLERLLKSFSSLEGDRILVHGGGRTATSIAASLGIETLMIDGRRVTDADTLKVVTMVYAGLVNKTIVAALQALGVDASGLSGADMDAIRSTKRPPVKSLDGNEVDYGYVGDVTRVNSTALASLIDSGTVPVMCPITHDGKGNLLNTNADTIASEVAAAMSSLTDAEGNPVYDVTLTYCFEKAGVLRDADDDTTVIPHITSQDFDSLVAEGVVVKGMIPKLQNAFAALKRGVGRVVITRYDSLDGGTTVTEA